jgi:hypothetical protein
MKHAVLKRKIWWTTTGKAHPFLGGNLKLQYDAYKTIRLQDQIIFLQNN